MKKISEKNIRRYISGEATRLERDEIMRRCCADHDFELEINALRAAYNSSLVNAPIKVGQKRKIRWMPLVAVTSLSAAMLLIGLVLGRNFKSSVNIQPFSVQTFTVPSGQRMNTVLSDGTSVWVKSNSTLKFINDNAAERRVVLDGEAYFEVAKDSLRPFIVETEHNRIKVLGTRFSVRANDGKDDFSTRLYEGPVAVLNARSEEIIRLKPNTSLAYQSGHYTLKSLDADSREYWIEGIHVFNDATYGEILKELGEYYGVQIIITSDVLKQYRCTCQFNQNQGVDHYLTILSLVHPFKWTWNTDRTQVTLSL
ncbi:MAG: FecR family protein [Candidatus Cryptobacteroides sp.]